MEPTNSTPRRPQKICVPTDLSGRSEVAVAYAGMLAEATDGDLVMVTNVNAPEKRLLEDFGRLEGLSDDEALDIIQRRMACRLAPAVPVTCRGVYADFPAEGIRRVAKAEGCDLLVIASHGRSGMQRLMLGSVAETLARSAEIPVVIVPVHEE